MTNLIELQSRMLVQLARFEAAERSWRHRWILLEGIILGIGLLTPLIVIYRKSGLYPTEFWVWWCLLTPPIAATCAILMRVTGVQDQCLTNRRRIRRVRHLMGQMEVEIPLCQNENEANNLYRDWSNENSKIELDY